MVHICTDIMMFAAIRKVKSVGGAETKSLIREGVIGRTVCACGLFAAVVQEKSELWQGEGLSVCLSQALSLNLN